MLEPTTGFDRFADRLERVAGGHHLFVQRDRIRIAPSGRGQDLDAGSDLPDHGRAHRPLFDDAPYGAADQTDNCIHEGFLASWKIAWVRNASADCSSALAAASPRRLAILDRKIRRSESVNIATWATSQRSRQAGVVVSVVDLSSAIV